MPPSWRAHSPDGKEGKGATAVYTVTALQSAMQGLEEFLSAFTRSEWLIGFDKKAQSRLRISFRVSWPGSPPDIRITRSSGLCAVNLLANIKPVVSAKL
jgi:hypothetical protein